MICPKCKIDVKPQMPFATCPECWSALPVGQLFCGGHTSQAIQHRDSLNRAHRLGIQDDHITFLKSYLNLRTNLENMYDLECPVEPDEDLDTGLAGVTEVVIIAAIICWYTIYEVVKYFEN